MKTSKNYYYYFASGKVVKTPVSLTIYEIGTFETVFGQWLFTEFN